MNVPVHIELSAIGFGAVSGAIHATRRGADLIGVLALAVAVGVGGGVLRDILLGAGPPLALTRPRYLDVVVASAVIAIFLGPRLAKLERVMNLVDAVLLGLWVVVGIQRAREQALPAESCIFLGVLTATGGGVLRDVLSGERSAMVSPGVLYVTPAICGAVSYFAVLGPFGPRVAELVAIAVASVLRALGLQRGWTLPTPAEVQDAFRRRAHVRRPSRPT